MLFIGLVYLVWFLSTYFIILVLLLLLSGIVLFENKPYNINYTPLVSVIIPAYNEEESIASTISSLKNVTYSNTEFIILSDGSSDSTSSIVTTNMKNDARFKFIDNKFNKGKAACLNQGITLAKGEFIACMDADSTIEPGIIQKVLPYFETGVGAVTVSVKVKKPTTFLEKIIDVEYLLGLSLFLKLFSKFDAIFVTPGPFSMYRHDMLQKIGGFDPTNIVEDHEIAYRIKQAGYSIRNCLEAVVETKLPPTFKGLYVQRRRWYSGAVVTLFQHRKMCFKSKYGFFSFFVPLNQVLIILGLCVFLYSTYLGLSNLFDNILYFRYVDFDIIARFKDFSIDLLTLNKTWFFGMSALAGTLTLTAVGLNVTHVPYKTKKTGILGYILMFFLYQVFWIGAYLAVIRGKRVKWR